MLLKDIETICPIHAESLKVGWAIVIYGLARISSEYRFASETQFPKSKFFVRGGCAPENEILHGVRYCSTCRNAHIEWSASNKSNEGRPPTEQEVRIRIEYHFGKQAEVSKVSEEILQLVRENRLVAAVKDLKLSNPEVSVTELRKHLHYLKNLPLIEQMSLAIKGQFPIL